jgi:uncharacterized repeat protein (TIGR03803 family)
MANITYSFLSKPLIVWFGRFLLVGSLTLLAACGGSGNEIGVFTVGGNVTGLNPGAEVTLNKNGDDPIVIKTNGQFTFNKRAPLFGSFTVTVQSQPSGQICTVINSMGAIIIDDVTDIRVICSATVFSVGGSVAGLNPGNQVILKNNSADAKTVAANGAFAFDTPVALGSGYTVTVGTQPVDQKCTISNYTGSDVSTNITNVTVICSATTYTISGQVIGLNTGSQVTLVNNGADPLTATNGAFTFDMPVASGGSFDVTVKTFPFSQFCIVKNGTGFNVSANVGNVIVDCGSFVKTTLYSFGVNNPTPNDLIQGKDSNFYGTTLGGGRNNAPSTFFKITPDGVETTLHVFFSRSDGTNPVKGLIQATDNNFYGITSNGGVSDGGTTYQISSAGDFKTFGFFNKPDNPNGVIQFGNALFGSTESGFFPNDKGFIYSIGPLGTIRNQVVLHSFTGLDGATPRGELIVDDVGNLYGTTVAGGANNLGTIFKLTQQGVLTTLYSFTGGANGAFPQTGVLLGRDGNLYGTTKGGGVNAGTVFKLTPNSVFTTLFSFSSGISPYAKLIQANDGNFYGTTFNGGVNNFGSIFRVTSKGKFTSLFSFGSTSAAIGRPSTLIQSKDGSFYGITDVGGLNGLLGGAGTFYRLVPLSI